MNPMTWSVLCTLLVVALASNTGQDNFCSWLNSRQCLNSEFRCLNGEKCIERKLYCNGINDCSDNSDENYCKSDSCPVMFIPCPRDNWFAPNIHRCIPQEWKCNGYEDCDIEFDEIDCHHDNVLNERSSNTATVARQNPAAHQNKIAIDKVERWINNQRKELNSVEKWGPHVDSLALIPYLINKSSSTSFSNKAEMTYELNIQMLSRISSMKLEDIPSTELASFINAFLVMCINPRNFYGYDVVQELRNRVEKEKYTNPYVLLALCNAGETISESDKNKLIEVFENKHRTFWTGMQAVVVIALACANKQPGNEVDSETLHEMTLQLKQQQYRNGTVVDLQTTALVMQALISMNSVNDPDNFDAMKAYQELLRNQKPNGSFGDVMDTFFVIPVLTCKSMADINSSHCQYESRGEVSALGILSRRSGPKIRVQYSLWFGNQRDLERNLILRVPQNTSLYSVMEAAAEVDSRFKLEYRVKSRKPYVSAISGVRDNPLTGKFWFLYVIEDGKPILSSDSPADILPKENDHYIMWYRRGTWVD